jgi:hypothetical protein
MKPTAVCCALVALAACGGTNGTSSTTGSTGLASATSASGSGSSGGTSSIGASSAGASSGNTSGGASGSSTGIAVSSNGGSNGTATSGLTGSTGSSSSGSAGGTGGTATGGLGAPCFFDPQSGADSCTPLGYECSAEFSTGQNPECILPQELSQCLANVGCQDGGPNSLECTPGFVSTSGPNRGQDVDVCVYPCSGSAECPSLRESCILADDICFINYCDQDPMTGRFQGPFDNPCPVLDAGDGECLSFDQGGLAVCFQNGSAAVGVACNPTLRTGVDSECQFGDYCVPNAAADGGLCFSITEDGGCGSGDIPLRLLDTADWGICAQDCSENQSCTFGTCQLLSDGVTEACLP